MCARVFRYNGFGFLPLEYAYDTNANASGIPNVGNSGRAYKWPSGEILVMTYN